MSLYDNLRMMLSKINWRNWTFKGWLLRAAVVVVAAVGLVFGFQNCSQAGFENQMLNMNSSSLASSATTNSFIYDVSVNQLGFMSCQLQGDPGINGTYFTFRVGAFDNTGVPSSILNIRPAGLGLSSTFQSTWASQHGVYNATNQTSMLENALLADGTSWNSQLQLSLRSTGSPATTLMSLPNYNSSTATYAAPSNMMAAMSTDGVAAQFATNITAQYNYFPNVTDFYSRALQGTVNLGSTPGAYYSSLLGNLSGSYLAIGFGSTASGTTANTQLIGTADSSGNPTGAAFGKGFRMAFGHVFPQQNQQNILSQVAEYDMSTGAPVAGVSWNCGYRLKIVRAEDRNNSIWVSSTTKVPACPVESYGDLYDPNHPERPAILNALRRFLPASQWDINVTRGCIVPYVADACYQQVSSTAPIIYDEYFFPTTNLNALQFSGCGYGTNQFQCANYLTMCLRQ